MKSKPRIAFVGDLTADVYMPSREIRLGGAALNMAVWAQRTGATATIISSVGTDASGKAFAKRLKLFHLTPRAVCRKRGLTSSIEIFVSPQGERRYGVWKPGVLDRLRVTRQMLRGQHALVVTIYEPYLHIFEDIRKIRAGWSGTFPFTIINYGYLPGAFGDLQDVERNLDIADGLIFGLDKDKDEARINRIRDLVRDRGMLTIVTLGAYGSVAWHGGESFVQAAKPVKVVDTTGAGDSFLAAFLVTYLRTKDIQKSLQRGTRVASRVIRSIGAY